MILHLGPGGSAAGFIASLVLMPPIMTCLWWLMSRAWGRAMQGGEMSPRTKRWVDGNFWRLMIFLYVMSFGMLAYAYLR